MKFLTKSIGLLLLPCALQAVELDTTLSLLDSEELFIGELPTVISATRLKQPLNESPVSTTIIDRQMIEASGAQTIPDLLRLVPGFTVGYLSGNYPVATYHGQSERYSRRLQVLIDGRSVYLPTLSGISWSDLVITIDEIERIEVIRGPNAASYGNNAFQAVVSITTKHASVDRGTYVKATLGSHKTADAIYRYSGRTDDMDYRISLGTKNNDGTDLLRDFTETDYASYRIDYQLDNDTQLMYQGGYQNSEYGNLQESDDYTPTDQEVDTAYQHLRLEHNFKDGNSLALQYYYNLTESYRSSYLTTIDGSTLGIDSFDVYNTVDLPSVRHDLEATYYMQPSHDLRLVLGGSVRLDKISENSVFDPGTDNSLMLYRGYSHGEYAINDNLLMNAGVMIETNDISGTDVAPRLAFLYHPSPQHSFRAGVSKATRTPVLFDEVGYYALSQTLTVNGGEPLTVDNDPGILAWLGSDTLVEVEYFSPGGIDSEEITSYELGWMMNLLDNRLTLDFKLFHNKSKKLISELKQDNDIPTENIDNIFPSTACAEYRDGECIRYYDFEGAKYFDNAASTRTRGLEFYSDYRIAHDLRLYTYFAYLLIDAEKTNPDAPDNVVGRLEESLPRRSYGGMLMKQWENSLNTSLAVYHVSDMDWLDRTHNRTGATPHTDRSAEEYTKVDLIVRKSFHFSQSRVDYSFILQNLAGSFWDYTRTGYETDDPTTIYVPGSLQDTRGYFEMAFKFN